MNSPLATGFVQGIAPAPKLEVIRQLAEQYGVTVRSIYRWQRDGVAIHDPLAVAAHLANQRGPSPAALAACKNLLETEISNP